MKSINNRLRNPDIYEGTRFKFGGLNYVLGKTREDDSLTIYREDSQAFITTWRITTWNRLVKNNELKIL